MENAPPNPFLQTPPSDKPTPVGWYKLYAGALAAFYLLLAVGSGNLAFFNQMWGSFDANFGTPEQLRQMGVRWLAVFATFSAMYLYSMFMPRTRLSYFYRLCLILLGLINPCSLLFALMLFGAWLKPEVRRYHGVRFKA